MFANNPEEMDEEMRIFYVAASRAELTLTLYRPRFNGQGNMTSASMFEPMLHGLVTQEKQARPAVTPGARIHTSRKIDLRSKMLGK